VGSGKGDDQFQKHAVGFTEAEDVFHDDHAITIPDEESDGTEKRFVTLGMGLKAVLLVVVYCYRGEKVRIISARHAEPHERRDYEESR
jgi:uncharacterized protein